MPLPSTGPISMSQVNTELGRSATANISLNETAVRTLAGVPSGAISMQNLRGKSASYSGTFAFNNAQTFDCQSNFFLAGIFLQTNGSINRTGENQLAGPTAFLNPLATGAGAEFEARAVNWYLEGLGSYILFNTNSSSPYGGTAPATTGWFNLGSAREFSVFASQGDYLIMRFTLEIRRISTGATISRTGVIASYYDF